MRFYGDMTQAQIGQQLGISQMHVSRLSARALGHLRARLLGQQDHPAGAARPGDRPGTRGLPDTATRPARTVPAHETIMKAIPLLRLDAGRKARDEDPELFFPIAAQSPGLDQVTPRKRPADAARPTPPA
jgi:hypothetical protein